MGVNSNRRINIWINGEEVEQKVGGIKAAMKTLNREIDQMAIGSKEYNEKAKQISQLDTVIKEHKKGIEGITHGWTLSIEAMALGMVSAHALMGLFHKAVGMFEESFTAYGNITVAETKLLISLGNRKDVQEDLLKQAKELQNTTTVKEVDIVRVQAFLAAQGRSAEQIKKTTHAALELSAATGWDLMESAKKADGTMEGFVREIKSLDSGFTTLTKAQLVNGAGVDLILKKYAGLAEGIADIGAGPIKQLGNVFENLKEIVGSWLASAILPAVRGMKDFVMGVNSYLEVPMSRKLEEEGTEVNKLMIELSNVNLKTDERKKLLLKLKEINPDIVAGLDAENMNYQKLWGNLKKYNNELANKIIISKEDEKIEKAAKDLASARMARIKQENEIMERMQKEVNHLPKGAGRDDLQSIMEDTTTMQYKIQAFGKALTKLNYGSGAFFSNYTVNFDTYVKEEGKALEYSTLTTETKIAMLKKLGINEADYMVDKNKELAAEKALNEKKVLYRTYTFLKLKKMYDEEGDELAGLILKEKNKNDKEKKARQYRLDEDFEFVKAKIAIEKEYQSGKIETQAMMEKRILSLEISTLTKRLAANKDFGEERIKLENELQDKLKKRKDNQNDDTAYMNKMAGKDSKISQENERYAEEMKAYKSHLSFKFKAKKESIADTLEMEEKAAMDEIKLNDSKYKYTEDEIKRLAEIIHKQVFDQASLTPEDYADSYDLYIKKYGDNPAVPVADGKPSKKHSNSSVESGDSEGAITDKVYIKKKSIKEIEDAALQAMEKEHQDKLNKIDADAIEKTLKDLQDGKDKEIGKIKEDNTEFLNSITTLEQAKEFLKKTMAKKELDKITDLEKAKKAIRKQQYSDMSKSEIDGYVQLQANLEKILKEGVLKDTNIETKAKDVFKDVVTADEFFSPEERKAIADNLEKVRAYIAHLKTLAKETQDALVDDENQKNAAKFHEAKKVDILGFSETDWNSLFINLKKGEIGVNEIVMAVDALKNAWSSYSAFLTASENKKNRDLEASDNKEKTALKTKLDKHLITQAAYDSKVLAMDTNLQKQKDLATYNQALRDSELNIVNAVQSAAVASIAIWKYGPAIAIPMELLIAGTLAASLAAIEANMPTAPAYAEGGFTNGDKLYRAGEKGPEWVASNSLIRDSKTAPVIKWLDNYQRGGKSIPMPIEANFSGMQTAVNNKYSSSNTNSNIEGILAKIFLSHQEGKEEMKLLNKYLSDPANRKARIVRDELTRFDSELATLQSLAKIR